MATRASAKRKRGSAPVSPPSDGRAARRARGSGGGASAAAAAEQEEPPTLIDVEGSWAEFMRTHREAGKFIDVTLVAGGRRIEAHKNVITSLSPYLDGLLTSGLAESAAQSQELTLEDMDGRAVEAVVDCMYSGKLALSPRSVMAVIRAANVLQVGAVEKAAGEFFVSKLEPSSAADALGFAAERIECGEHAKLLHEGCVGYAIEHFAAVSREASFLSMPCETVASLIASDDLPADEQDVVSAVRSWFEHDAERRTGSLRFLLPLVRWPLLPVDTRRALCDEPLLIHLMRLDDNSRTMSLRMMLECSSDLREEDCPRLKLRKGTRLICTTQFRRDSAILTSSTPGVTRLLQDWLPGPIQRLELLWRASRDGWGAEHFHGRCDGKGTTLTVMKSTGGFIFGGFTKTPWSSPSASGGKRSLGAFLFALQHAHSDRDGPVKMKLLDPRDEFAVYHSGHLLPCFGSPYLDLWNHCGEDTKRYTVRMCSYKPQPQALRPHHGNYITGTEDCKCTLEEIEVFHVVDD